MIFNFNLKKLPTLRVKDGFISSAKPQPSVFDQDGPPPAGIHTVMFTPTIQKQGTEAQITKWLPFCQSYAIVGTYAQTELGHGMNGIFYSVFCLEYFSLRHTQRNLCM